MGAFVIFGKTTFPDFDTLRGEHPEQEQQLQVAGVRERIARAIENVLEK